MQTSVEFLCDTMKIKKFNGFDKNGYLPYGVYNLNMEEFKSTFCKNSPKREKIMEEYEKHLSEIKNTGYFPDHWIDGSFVSSKEDPSDIDTLTEFDGLKVDENNDRQKIDDLIYNSKSRTNGLCHSLRIYQYPPQDKERYKYFIESKLRILIKLYGTDRIGIPKGIIHLLERNDEIQNTGKI